MDATNLLSPKQAAAYMGCTVSKIRKDIRLKKLAIVRVGSLVRIRKDFLDRWIEANTQMPCGVDEKADREKPAHIISESYDNRKTKA